MCNLLTYSLPHESDILSSSSITLRTNELSFHEIIPARPNDITTFGNLTLEFCKSLQVPNPSYVQGTYFTTSSQVTYLRPLPLKYYAINYYRLHRFHYYGKAK
jgi:hypothetical protein